MKVLTNLVKRNLILNKRRTIVTIISIILSCALIGGVATLICSFQKFMQDTEIEVNGNYHAVFNNVPLDKVKYIENNAYIEEAMRSTILGYAHFKGGTEGSKPYLLVEAFDKKQFGNTPLKLVKGRLPKSSDELVISDQIENQGGVKYQIGDTITLELGDRYLDNRKLGLADSYVEYISDGTTVEGVTNSETLVLNKTHQYKIVGIIEKPNFEGYDSAGYMTITYLDAKALALVDSINISVITKDPKDIFEKLTTIAEKNHLTKVNGQYEIDYHSGLLRWYGVTDNDNANDMLYGFEAILIVVIMIASIIVIYNSFNISITERKKQFGMLSSIGTTSKQIRNMVIKEGVILSLIGIPLGVIGSIIGIGITLEVVNNLGIFERFYSSELTLTVSSLSILITIIFGGLTIFISSFIPAIKASRTSPIDAIRLSTDIKIKGKKLRTRKLTRKLFGIEGELAAKNMKRNRKKYRSTIISIFVSIVLFMTVNAFAEYSFRSSLKVYNDYNFNVAASSSIDTLNGITKLDYVDKYSISDSVYYNIYVDKKELNSKIADQMSGYYDKDKGKYYVNVKLSTLGKTEFRRYVKGLGGNINDYLNPSKPKVILMNKSNFYSPTNGKEYQIELVHLKTKDIMSLSNDIESKSMEVGKITATYPLGFNNVDSQTQTIQGFISNEVFDTLGKSPDVKEDSSMFIQSSKPEQLVKEIEALVKDKGISISVQNIAEMVQQMKNLVLAIYIFLYGFITLVSLITITNVINTITTSIYLRRREFAMLKAVGMTNKSFNKMIRFESIFYGLKGLLYGLPFGMLIDYFLYKNTSSMFVYDYEIPYRPILICVAFVFIIISITMAYSVRKIRNDNIVDVIKQENL